MTPEPIHYHNGTDSNQITFNEAIVGAPQPAITLVSGTAGATYTGTEQTLINALTVAVNKLITELKALGVTL